MKKLYYLLLLSLFTSFIFMSNDQENKNKVLAQQLSTINTQFQKWKKELEGYKKWASENDGVVSAEEKAEIERRQKDMDAILARVAQIVKAKGLLALMGLPTKEETKATAEIKENEILPTETTLERPDPLKSVAALDNEEAIGMLGGPNPEVTVTEDDHIPKFAFIQKAQSVLNSFDNFSIKDDYQLDAATAISLLGAVPLSTPLGTEIKQTIISKIPAGKISINAINLAIVYAAQFWNNKDRLGEHYEKNEAAYSAKETTETVTELKQSHLDNDINALKTFFNTLKESNKEAEDKKKEEEAKKKKEEEAKKKEEEEKEKELKEEKEKFDELFIKWSQDCDKEIVASDSMKARSVSKKILVAQYDYAFGKYNNNPLVADLFNIISAQLEEDKNGTNNTTLQGLIIISNKAVDEVYKRYLRKNNTSLFDLWLENEDVFPSPGRLRNWLENSVPMQQHDFVSRLNGWVESVTEAVSEPYEEKSWTRFSRKAVIMEFSDIFNYNSKVIHDLFNKYFLPEFNKVKSEVISIEELIKIWNSALRNFKLGSSVIYEDLLKNSVQMIEFMEDFPKSSLIAFALDQSEYIESPKLLPKPNVQDSLMELELNMLITPLVIPTTLIHKILIGLDRVASTSALTTLEIEEERKLYEAFMGTKGNLIYRIPLKFEELKTSDGEQKWFPVPIVGDLKADYNDSTLNVTSIELRPISSAIISKSKFSKKYTIAMTFGLPTRAISAATGSSLSAIYSRSAEWSTQFSLATSLTTVFIDISIIATYKSDKQIEVEIEQKPIDIRKVGFSTWFYYCPYESHENMKRELSAF